MKSSASAISRSSSAWASIPTIRCIRFTSAILPDGQSNTDGAGGRRRTSPNITSRTCTGKNCPGTWNRNADPLSPEYHFGFTQSGDSIAVVAENTRQNMAGVLAQQRRRRDAHLRAVEPDKRRALLQCSKLRVVHDG